MLRSLSWRVVNNDITNPARSDSFPSESPPTQCVWGELDPEENRRALRETLLLFIRAVSAAPFLGIERERRTILKKRCPLLSISQLKGVSIAGIFPS